MKANEVVEKALEQVVPTNKEKKALEAAIKKIVDEIKRQGKSRASPVRPILVGSTAKDTWISGVRDIDIFLAYPESLSREELEAEALTIARLTVNSLKGRYEEWYAEHPYLKSWIGGYQVDLVPCYYLSSLAEIKSAVDRSPFHTKYMKQRLTPKLTNEVRLLKQFMKGVGVYGSDLRTRGFSGYLCEILILAFDSFLKLLKEEENWEPKIVIDLEGHAIHPEKKFREPLVVVDPVDKDRNVAAAVSKQSLFQFIVSAKAFLEEPSLKFFFPEKPKPLEDEGIVDILQSRGTRLICLGFSSPRVIADILWPQLEKTKNHLEKLLKSNGFRILRSEVWSNSVTVLLFELEVDKLPLVERHIGPPIFVSRKNQKEFLDKWKKTEKFSGPWLDEDRWIVEVKRNYQDAQDLLWEELENNEEKLVEMGYPKYIARGISRDGKLYIDRGILELCHDDDFKTFITDYLLKSYSWI